MNRPVYRSLAVVFALTLGAGGMSCGSDDGDGGNNAGSGGSRAGSGGNAGGSGGSSGGSGGSSAGSGGSAAGSGGASGGMGGEGGAMGGAGGEMGGAGGADAGMDAAADTGMGGMGGSMGGMGGSMGGMGGSMGGAGGGMGIQEFRLVVSGVAMRGDRLVFVNGQTNGTGNRSPGFEWGPHPEAKSYALSMVDQCNNGTHWVIYDIPATVTKLPPELMRPSTPNVPEVPGAKHTRFSGGNPYGYFGPGAGSCNRYNFIVHAMMAETLPEMSNNKNDIRSAVFNTANRIAATAQVQVVGNNGAGQCTGGLGCGP